MAGHEGPTFSLLWGSYVLCCTHCTKSGQNLTVSQLTRIFTKIVSPTTSLFASLPYPVRKPLYLEPFSRGRPRASGALPTPTRVSPAPTTD
jgi:hypothetical protein